MRSIFLYFLLFKCCFSDEESDEKYIDLLPEEEKRQFLEKIARRILEDYQNSKEPNASHVEMIDGDLDAHSVYIQGLLQEETQHLRDEKNAESHRRGNNEDQKKLTNSDMKTSLEKDNNYIGKREKRRNGKEIKLQASDAEIPVIPIYDDKKTNDHNGQSTKTTSKLNQKTDDHSREDNDSFMKNSQSLRKLFVYDDEDKSHEIKKDEEALKSTVMDNFDTSTRENVGESSNENQKITNETATVSDSSDPQENPVNNVREGDLTRHDKNDTFDYSEENNSSYNDTDLTYTTQSSRTTENFISTVSKTVSNYDTNYERDYSTSGLKLVDIDNLNHTTFTTSSENRSRTEESLSTTKLFSIITSTTEEPTELNDIKTPTVSTLMSDDNRPSNLSKVQTMSIKLNGDPSKSDNTNNIIESKFSPNILRSGTEIIGVNTIESIEILKSRENKPTYYVYEVSAEKPPFRNLDKNDEHYYAPVYNYDPKYAYYNPRNRYEPKSEENTSKFTNYEDAEPKYKYELRNRFRNPASLLGDEYKFNNMYNILKKPHQYNFKGPHHVVANSENYNPNDYIDMDYFFGRNEFKYNDYDNAEDLRSKPEKHVFPDTDEIDHPYKSSLQDHVRAVRKLLYASKQFGYIPERLVLDDGTLRAKDVSLDVFDDIDQKHRDDITLDYYFGRQNSHESSADEEQLFKLKLSDLKDLMTATPNPIHIKRLNNEVKDKGKYVKNEEMKDDLEPLVNVLRDMIRMDNEAMITYDWFGTTVDIQSALSKLIDLTAQLKDNTRIHPSDLELLKYVIYLYKSTQLKEVTLSAETLKNTIEKLRKRMKKKSLIPKINKKKNFVSAITMWKDFRTFLRTLFRYDKREVLNDFQRFLKDVRNYLNDLHDAIKHIATITTYKNQRWYEDLKDIYLRNADRKKLLTVILHLSTYRMFDYIEDSSRNGVEDSFIEFVKKRTQEIDETKNELKLVLRLLRELEGIN